MGRRYPLVGACVSVGLFFSTVAHAEDTWTDPFPGVRLLHRVTSSQNINVLRVELCAAGISFRTTKQNERGQTPSAFAKSVGAQAAVNGDFYISGFALERGIAVGDGEAWDPSTIPEDESVGQIAFGDDRVELIRDSVLQKVEPWMKNVVGGRPTLLVDGETQNFSGHPVLCKTNPRTAVGLDKSKNVLFVTVVDGRAPPSRTGMTCNELAALMKDLGANDALAFDGGGSSSMWLEGQGLVNRPSDTNERVVSNHLAFYAKGKGKPGSCESPPTGTVSVTCEGGIKGSVVGAPDPVDVELTFDAEPGSARATVLPAPTSASTELCEDAGDAGTCGGVGFGLAIPPDLEDGKEHTVWATFKGRPADVIGTGPLTFTCGSPLATIAPSDDPEEQVPSRDARAASVADDGCQAAPGRTGGLFAKLAGGILLASLLERTRRRRTARHTQDT